MWYYGGMYVDVDQMINPRNFDDVFKPTIKMCLPIHQAVNFAQSLLCSSPKNELFLEVVKEMSNYRMHANNGNPVERRDGWATSASLFSMGPPLYNRMVFKIVFGKEITGQGKIRDIEEYMKRLQNEASDIIVTGQFQDQCNSFIAQNYEGCQEWERTELYQAYNMPRWGIAVKMRWGQL